MNRKTLLLPAAAGLLTTALTGCGSSDGSGSDGAAVVVGITDHIEATPSAPAPLDPAQAYDTPSWTVMHNAFQTLMRLPRSGTEPVPDAAQSCGFQDKQSEQYRCTLRPGLKFSNGHDLTAADVKFSLDRVRNINFKNGPASLLSGIDKVETPSERVVVIHLTAPDATFPSKLTTPATAILDSEVYQGKGLYKGFETVGSGPYSMEPEVKDNRLVKAVFTRNKNYQGTLEPKSDKVEIRFFDDSEALEEALSDGEVGVVPKGLNADQIERLQAGEVKGIRISGSAGQAIRYLGFNTDAPVVRDKVVRQAIAHVVDRQALVRDAYKRTADALYSMVPTGTTAHINSFYNKYGEPSIPAARRLLQHAGVQTPVKLTLAYSSDHYGQATTKEFTSLRDQLNGSGLFQADIKRVKWTSFRPAAADGKYAVYGMGWSPDFPDPDNYVAPFVGKKNFLNSPYHNSTIEDQLIPATRQKAQRSLAARDFQRIQDLIAEDVPLLPLWQGKEYVAYRDGVTGTEYIRDSSSMLQLWELGRGASA
ncbi:ABC transporter substrate-binding protein [Streptomyces palmae]|uniref:Peptide-binding protein n=1 Tax=Streptomyces palmae TaxID=1701085 RepID=A0A4Z0GIC2_9ACTN|nr:ABC transporter substrate-binding protein [Streptomyces palmae]TGA95222.1 peptide-binding protein [Streptomyces palmae]